MMRPFRRFDGSPVKELAPYQDDVWNDRFRDQRSRYYIKGPGVGISKLLLMETLNVILANERRIDALVLVASRREARRRRDEVLDMIEGSKYSGCLVRRHEYTNRMGTHAAHEGTGIVLRPPGDALGEQASGITFRSAVGFVSSSINMHHVLVLDAMESGFPTEAISMGMAHALTSTMLTGGKMVVAMTPRAPFYRLGERMPGINDTEPGEALQAGEELARRIPMSIAADAGIIERSAESRAEMRLLDKDIRDAKYPMPR